MESTGSTYTSYAGHLFLRYTNVSGLCHGILDTSRLTRRAKKMAQAAEVPQRRQRVVADVLHSATWGLACNPFAGVDYATGTGAHNAYNAHLKVDLLRAFDRDGHRQRMHAVMLEERACVAHYDERGVGGEVLQGIFATAAIPGFALGAGVGSMLGVAYWAVQRLAYGADLAAPFRACVSRGRQTLGCLFGIVAGIAALLTPWLALQATRLTTAAAKAICVGAAVLLALPWATRHLWQQPPAMTPLQLCVQGS